MKLFLHILTTHPNRQIIISVQVHLTCSLENLPRSINFFFSFLTLTTTCHHGNNQINILTFSRIRKTWMILISDALEYVHATVFLHFWKAAAAHPWSKSRYCIKFFLLSPKLRNPIILYDARVNSDLASSAPVLLYPYI